MLLCCYYCNADYYAHPIIIIILHIITQQMEQLLVRITFGHEICRQENQDERRSAIQRYVVNRGEGDTRESTNRLFMLRANAEISFVP